MREHAELLNSVRDDIGESKARKHLVACLVGCSYFVKGLRFMGALVMFHLQVEFNEVKESCRKRLDGHNRHRRKPQPESINFGLGGIFSNHQVLLRYGLLKGR
ncbi:Golgi SNAP receptor complex member 1-2-like isoform X1 [Iris pallida]|uniref:Golgi SNAP receptor complex member 1-2-like isoform X1 n=1 Tax=Iris pallida TaxID=29817 RepID=A0AAX6GL42_IRIPA|nr:Golgi SNAP receptor complex member 1-2-like isoform X1 [Iris pallida]KAJ6829410.1 Golgi SNAP receptor complex member 1-2-like isoform X1 [Iris pallida]